jgi:hypothetical protein
MRGNSGFSETKPASGMYFTVLRHKKIFFSKLLHVRSGLLRILGNYFGAAQQLDCAGNPGSFFQVCS